MSAVPDAASKPGSLDVDAARPWVVLAKAGDSRAFEKLYRQQVGRIYALCLRMVRDPQQAEGLTQDIFVRAWQKLGTLRDDGAFCGWLYRLAVRLVVEDRRRVARTRRWLDEEPEVEAMSNSLAARSDLAGNSTGVSLDTLRDLAQAIDRLPPGARLVFLLHDVQGYRHREISKMTGAAEGTIKAQLHRARGLLRRTLGVSLEEGTP